MTADIPIRGAPSPRALRGHARALLLDPTARDLMDRTVRLAALALRAPVAMLGVPEFGWLQVAGEMGLPDPWRELGHVPLDASYCRHVVRTGDLVAIDDTARHAATFTVPRLENYPRVAYCGAPLVVDGAVVAVLAVTDVEPRRWMPEETAALRELAATVLRDLELVTTRLDRIQAPEPVLRPPARALPHDREESPAAALPTLAAPPQATPLAISAPAHSSVGEAAPPVLAEPAVAGGRDAPDTLPTADERYRWMFEDSLAPLFVMTADGTLVEVNRAFEELAGMPREDIVGRSLLELGADAETAERLIAGIAHHGSVADIELVLRRPEDADVVCAVAAGTQEVDGRVVFHGTCRDVTAQKEAEAELQRSALHDPLTGLPNRLVFMDRLERLLTQAQRRQGYRFAVVFLDLDNFKHVNDTHGHLVGDQLLVTAAHRLAACLRQGDTVARMGGDEFAVLLDAVTDVASVTWVVDRMRDELSVPFTAEGRLAGATASIGIAMSTDAYTRAEDLLRDADEAMYRAKVSGRNSYVIFDSNMHERAVEQRRLEEDLRVAIQHDQLSLHYQPVIELSGGSVAGLEALLRWEHPVRGPLLPGEFVPLAEQTGLIIDIGWWVLREACRQLHAWQRDFPHAATRLTMSVNVSARQFEHPHLLDRLDGILAETGLAPHCLRLDLTEAVVMQDSTAATRVLRALRERGIQICLDDFGTGYSSIQRLREFPLSMLKIDQSFIRTVVEDGASREIVQTIIGLGRSMGVDAVAEGVETPEQLEQLRRLGTRFAQGFLFSLPLDAAAATGLMAAGVKGRGARGRG